MTSWRWADPMYLSWLVLVPLFYVMAVFLGRRKMKKITSAFGEKMLPFLLSGYSIKKYQIKLVLNSYSKV